MTVRTALAPECEINARNVTSCIHKLIASEMFALPCQRSLRSQVAVCRGQPLAWGQVQDARKLGPIPSPVGPSVKTHRYPWRCFETNGRSNNQGPATKTSQVASLSKCRANLPTVLTARRPRACVPITTRSGHFSSLRKATYGLFSTRSMLSLI